MGHQRWRAIRYRLYEPRAGHGRQFARPAPPPLVRRAHGRPVHSTGARTQTANRIDALEHPLRGRDPVGDNTMFTRLSNSWELIKASAAVLRADKELLI